MSYYSFPLYHCGRKMTLLEVCFNAEGMVKFNLQCDCGYKTSRIRSITYIVFSCMKHDKNDAGENGEAKEEP